jgi:hypothetical protein
LNIFGVDISKHMVVDDYYNLDRVGVIELAGSILVPALKQGYALLRDRNHYLEIGKDFLYYRDNNESGKFTLTGIVEFIFSPKEAAYGDVKLIYDKGNYCIAPISKMNFLEIRSAKIC